MNNVSWMSASPCMHQKHSDIGVAIAKEDLPYIFERLWGADESRDRHSGGTGIGLTISRRLMELQGG